MSTRRSRERLASDWNRKEFLGAFPVNNRIVFTAMVVLFVAYSINVYTAGTSTPHLEPMSDQSRLGQQVFQEHNCIACHQFYGLGGYMGPDLTNVISNRGAAYARAFIVAGTVRMPKLDLTESEADALIAYLAFVDSTGRYPAEDFDVHWYGTVAQADDPQ